MAEGDQDFEDMSPEGIMQGMYEADLARNEARLREERRARKALRAESGEGSMTISELAAKMAADDEVRFGRAIAAGGDGSKKTESPEAARAAAAERPAKAGGKFPPPPTGGSK